MVPRRFVTFKEEKLNNLRILDEIFKAFLSNANCIFHRLELRKQRNTDDKAKEENGGEE